MNIAVCDALGRLTGTTHAGIEQRYEYDATGNRTRRELVGTGVFTETYDALGRLESVRVPAGERYTLQYDADSRRTTMLLGLGSKRGYRYDDAGRLTTQVESNASNVGIHTMVDGYDAVGDRTSRNTNGTPCTWSYDHGYRLTGQQKSGQYATFAYDANSNLTLKWHQGGGPRTMQYDAADRVTTMQAGGTTSTMQWGQRGVLAKLYETGAIKATYSYADITNDLTRSEETGTVTTAVFDGDDLRRKTVLSGVTTTFVWDGPDYLQIKPSSGDATLLISLMGEVVGHVKGSEKRDYVTDPLGSVVAYLNDSQALTDQFEYWPYGELAGEIEAGVGPFLWVGSLGYFRDSDLGTYIRARTYRQDLGSWTQLDPLWPTTPAHGYARRPTTEADPSGLIVPVLIVVGIGAGMLIGGFLPPYQPPPPTMPPNYDPTPNPFAFGYGWYCGLNRQYPCRKNGQVVPAMDCLDRACAEHDSCLPTGSEYFSPLQIVCAQALCSAIVSCIATDSCLREHSNPRKRAECLDAARNMAAFCCLLGSLGKGSMPTPPMGGEHVRTSPGGGAIFNR